TKPATPRIRAYKLRKMSMQKPPSRGIAKDPEPISVVILDPVIIPLAPTRAVLAPPFRSEAFRPFRTKNVMLLPPNEKLHRNAARNQRGDFDAHRRLNQPDGADTVRPYPPHPVGSA